MPTSPLRSVLQAILSRAGHGLSLRSDAELLTACASARDEAAFAEMVRRHGRLVRGTAQRILRDPDSAEDVFQTTFLLLARRASAICWGPTVGAWPLAAGLSRRSARTLPARLPTARLMPATLRL